MRWSWPSVMLLVQCLAVLLPAALANGAAEPVGRIVFVQGQVAIKPAGRAAPLPAKAGTDLFAGDALATGPAGRAAVLCLDESQIKLNENTVMVFKAVAPSARLAGGGVLPAAGKGGGASLYDVPQGEVWLKNEAERFRFELSTPAVTAAIRGTELTVKVAEGGETAVALVRGALTLFNPQGEIPLASGELGLARPGQAPTKQVLVNPEDAVQWTLYYPAVLPSADLSPAGLPPAEAAPLEAALARVRDGDVAGAWLGLAKALPGLAASPQSDTLAAYVALMAGEPAAAGRLLAKALAQDPGYVPARCLSAQIALYQNRKDAAAAEAAAVLAAAPDSPLAQITAGLAAMAAFDLPAAKARFAKALELDPSFVAASVYLARIELGADDLKAAERTMRAALAAAPNEGLVLATAGFVRLGLRDFAEASALFSRAAAADPGLGDARLGLGLVAFARGQTARGVSEMLAATLLSPHVSLAVSTLGKALYQARAFDKALAAYDDAFRLDPRDPTPHLYKGIALTDLNRPGEAVEAINASIARNDNQAVFRSRLALDRDLAVRNVDLAKAFNQLGLGDWAYAKAVTAVKNDPLSPSAHLFLFHAYRETRQRVGAAGSELLLFRLLSPANQNTFTLYNDYTPMFEMPYLRLETVGSGGFWSNGKGIWSASANAYGGLPGLAGNLYAAGSGDEGFREPNGYSRFVNTVAQLKWEPTVFDSLQAMATTFDEADGDTRGLNDWSFAASPYRGQAIYKRDADLGYVHRFGPTSACIVYAAVESYANPISDRGYDVTTTPGAATASLFDAFSTKRFMNVQTQQQLVLGDHTLMAGGDYFDGDSDFLFKTHDLSLYRGAILGDTFSRLHFTPPDRSGSLYAVDYWKILPGLVAELAFGFDAVATSRDGWPHPIDTSLFSPKAGLNWRIDPDNTLRLAFQRYLNTHTIAQGVIAPSETAGFPGRINAEDGAVVTEAGAAWEAQWNERTFTVAKLDFHRLEIPQYDPFAANVRRMSVNLERSMATLGLNRILAPYLGLSLFGVVKGLAADNDAVIRGLGNNFFEADAALSLSFLHQSGLGASVTGTAAHQHFFDGRYGYFAAEHRADTLFGLLDAKLSYEFPGKRGFVSVEGKNLTATRFAYRLEPLALDIFYPDRQVVFKLGWYF